MRPHIIATIFRKEIREALRDRLTVIVVLLLPLLIYPLMLIGMSKLRESQELAQEERPSQIAIWGIAPGELVGWLKRTNSLALENWKGAPESLRTELEAGKLEPPAAVMEPEPSRRRRSGIAGEQPYPADRIMEVARSLLSSRKADAVLIIWPGFDKEISRGGLGKISIYFDSVLPASEKARERLNEELVQFRRNVVQQRERQHGLAEGFARAVEISSRNTAPASRRTGQVLGVLLPFLVIILSATGSVYAAIDLTAGEKDRGTMQTLMCAPLRTSEIVCGKFLAVWVIGLISAGVNTASMAATLTRVIAPMGMLNLSPWTYLWTFAMLLPVTFTISAFFLAVAVLARDAKDAGNFLGPAVIVLMMPLGATMTPGVELDAWTSFVPLVNIALLIKALFIAEARPEFVFLTLVSSAIYAMLALLFAARVFGREQVLLGGKDSVRSIFRVERGRDSVPAPGFVLAAFALIFVLAFYGSLMLQNASILKMMLVTQYGFFLFPVLAFTVAMKFSPRETFSLRLPHWRGVLAAILMGLSAWAVISGVAIRLLPPPDSLVRALEKILLLGDKPAPLWALWLTVGLTPAICEELLFRGLILSGLRRLGKWPAILLSAFLFALAHSSIYRLLPSLLMGVLLGYTVWRTGSILCGMIVHALNNGLMVTLVHSESLLQRFHLQDTPYLPWHLALAATVILIFSLLLLRSVPRHEFSPSPPV
jgi:sodium transport system permease protein